MKKTSSIWYMIKTDDNGVVGQLYGSYFQADFYRKLYEHRKNYKIVKVKITEIKKKKKQKKA